MVIKNNVIEIQINFENTYLYNMYYTLYSSVNEIKKKTSKEIVI